MAYNYEDNINTLNNDETKFNNDNYVYNDKRYTVQNVLCCCCYINYYIVYIIIINVGVVRRQLL